MLLRLIWQRALSCTAWAAAQRNISLIASWPLDNGDIYGLMTGKSSHEMDIGQVLVCVFTENIPSQCPPILAEQAQWTSYYIKHRTPLFWQETTGKVFSKRQKAELTFCWQAMLQGPLYISPRLNVERGPERSQSKVKKTKKIEIIMADQTSNPMQKGVCTVYPFFALRVKPGNKYLNVNLPQVKSA